MRQKYRERERGTERTERQRDIDIDRKSERDRDTDINRETEMWRDINREERVREFGMKVR